MMFKHRDLLRCAVISDLKVLFIQIRDQLSVQVFDSGKYAHQLHVDLKHAGLREGNADESDGP